MSILKLIIRNWLSCESNEGESGSVDLSGIKKGSMDFLLSQHIHIWASSRHLIPFEIGMHIEFNSSPTCMRFSSSYLTCLPFPFPLFFFFPPKHFLLDLDCIELTWLSKSFLISFFKFQHNNIKEKNVIKSMQKTYKTELIKINPFYLKTPKFI